MASFVHITAEHDLGRIRTSGIRVSRHAKWRQINGVFLSAVTADFMQTHQWHREVQRTRNVPKVVIRVRIPDCETVYIGKYNEQKLPVTAAESIKISLEHSAPEGLEVILPRSIAKSEIQSVYRLRRPVGWRYHPAAKGKRPCGCSYCQRGEPGARKLREQYENGL